MSPTATATSASPSSTWRPARSSATGARTATSRTTRNLGTLQSRARRPRSSSATRCTAPSCRNDGIVYVCDRPNDRIQVFTKGRQVREGSRSSPRTTRGDGSVWDIAFSKDPQQKYFYLADGANEKIHVFDRESLTELTSFGDGGRQPGQFYAVHSIAADSKGNLYTTETYRGQRLQKFVYKGLAPVTKPNQGTGLADAHERRTSADGVRDQGLGDSSGTRASSRPCPQSLLTPNPSYAIWPLTPDRESL
mgnify:CR=1 FL=1